MKKTISLLLILALELFSAFANADIPIAASSCSYPHANDNIPLPTLEPSLILPPLPPTGITVGVVEFSILNLLSVAEASHPDYGAIYWSNNNQLSQCREDIITALQERLINEEERQSYYDALKIISTLRKEARELYNKNNIEEATYYQELALLAASAVTSLTPGISWGRDVYELLSGRDLITGEELDDFEIAMAGLGVVTAGFGSKIRHVGTIAKKLKKIINTPKIVKPSVAEKVVANISSERAELVKLFKYRKSVFVTKSGALGFKNAGSFSQFGKALYSGLTGAGYGGTKALLQGSAVSGKSFRTGKVFDKGRVSDFDIALAGKKILVKAKKLGIKLRSQGTRTGPLDANQVKLLGLGELQSTLSKSAGRPVNFMIFGDAAAAAK